jgi:serine/threonine protein kinase
MSASDPPTFPLPARYEYAGETLAGGQGKVYVCRDKNLERQVAIKALHAAINIAAMLTEIAAHSKVKSKHVVELYEVLADGSGTPYAIVLEYVPGDSLQNIAKLPPTFEGRLRVLYQIACGLEDIHDAQVIHRDIKPDNMKMDADGVLKLFDMGISNLNSTTAVTTFAAGTPVYRAPELHGPPPLPVSCAADIYAFGVVAWHVLNVGKFPGPLMEVPPQSSGVGVPSLQTLAAELSSHAAVLDRTLKVQPTDRPTADEVRQALAELLTKGKRRGVFAYGSQTWEVTAVGNVMQISLGPRGTLEVVYNGLKFVVRAVNGSIYINNRLAAVGEELPESCVLTFGAPELGASRGFVAFNASQPEIVL